MNDIQFIIGTYPAQKRNLTGRKNSTSLAVFLPSLAIRTSLKKNFSYFLRLFLDFVV